MLLERRELLHAAAYTAALLWINAYICRGLFSASTAYMNSMHGFWIALAKMSSARRHYGQILSKPGGTCGGNAALSGGRPRSFAQ